MSLRIRRYRRRDEGEWIKCHMLVDLEASGGELLKEKPKYDGKSIELVATIDDKIIGFLDIELEGSPGKICYKKIEGNGMLWDIGVLKEYRRQGIATRLLNEGINRARRYGLQRLEAWTVEENAKRFYENNGFTEFYKYHHIRINKRENLKAFDKNGLHIISLYAHIMPETNLEDVIKKYNPKEVFECLGFKKDVTT